MLWRQAARKRNRIAEISVPACPMPTQKTKLVMYVAHMAGRVMPSAPIPCLSW